MPAQAHSVEFHRNANSGIWRGVCTCGWFHFGPRDQVQARAATHDLEWIADDPKRAVEQVPA